MKYSEIHGDLFATSEDYRLAHCISSDFGMGGGIVLMFNKLFNMKNILMAKYPNYMNDYFIPTEKLGDCIPEGRVYNLITKERVYQKPTYSSLKAALEIMRNHAVYNGVAKIAMPLIGCGIDGLDWNIVAQIIKDIFEATDIEILICIR